MGKKELGFGALAGTGIFLFYVGVLTLSQGFGHAVEQLTGLWFLIVPLAAGFGAQVYLFFSLRALAGGVAASGGLTAGSMAACCAHHLADVVPVLGLAGVAGFFVAFQVPFMVLGVAANAVGITIMLGMAQKYGKWTLGGVDMGQAKSGVVVLAVAGVAVTFFLAALYPAAGAQPGGAGGQGAGRGLTGGDVQTAKMGETILSGGTGPGEVSIELTPPVREGKVEVAVAVNTHSVDLTLFDLKQLATLTAGGRDYKPVEAPVLSGHHTTGTMVFEVGELEQMEIVIRGVPAVAERTFTWV